MSHDALDLELLRALEAEDYYLSEQSLSHFTRAAWEVLEPETQYLHNWHVDCIAEHLEAVYAGELTRLIVNIPPRFMKSIQITVCFPAWVWVKNAARRFITGSYANALSLKHAVDRRSVIESPWYQKGWGNKFQLAADQNQKSEMMNTRRGHMIATSVGGSSIGKGGDILIMDDPHNPLQAESEAERETALRWFDLGFTTRVDNKKTGAIIVVMQRLHEKDLTGHLLAKGGWHHLNLPMVAPTKSIIVFPASKREVTREEGDLLWPDRMGAKEVEQAKTDLGSVGFQAQMQQDPRPSEGGFFKRHWWKRYTELPKARLRRVMFIDCAEKPGVTNDYSIMATWDETETGYHGVDLWRNKVEFPSLEQAVKDNFALHKPDAIVIEDKSAGTQLIQNLRAETTLPIIPFNPGRRDKVVRAAGAQPTVEAGNCYLPESRPWVELFIEEHEKFPNSEHDDQVDTTSMMVEHFRGAIAQPRIRTL